MYSREFTSIYVNSREPKYSREFTRNQSTVTLEKLIVTCHQCRNTEIIPTQPTGNIVVALIVITSEYGITI